MCPHFDGWRRRRCLRPDAAILAAAVLCALMMAPRGMRRRAARRPGDKPRHRFLQFFLNPLSGFFSALPPICDYEDAGVSDRR